MVSECFILSVHWRPSVALAEKWALLGSGGGSSCFAPGAEATARARQELRAAERGAPQAGRQGGGTATAVTQAGLLGQAAGNAAPSCPAGLRRGRTSERGSSFSRVQAGLAPAFPSRPPGPPPPPPPPASPPCPLPPARDETMDCRIK